MLEGFCCQCAADVPISADRRCMADGSLVLAPSTACLHQRLIDGAWTACTCKPVAAGTWRKILAQQAKVIEKRDRDRAALRFSAASPTPPRLATTHKPQQTPKAAPPKREPQRLGPAPLPLVPCPACGTGFKPYKLKRGHRQQFCSLECANRVANHTLETVPCPVCAMPFVPKSYGAGKRRKTCSADCAQIRQRQSLAARQPASRPWHPQHVSCSDCHGTTRPYYRQGRCRPCFDVWDQARQYRQVAS
jgi:hypothetical protein